MKHLLFALAILLAGAHAASAQPPFIEARTAFGASNYLHGDIDYVAPTVVVAARVGRDRVAIEPEVTLAWHSRSETFPGAIVTGPVVVDRSHAFRSVAVNAIARGRGRVSPYIGGGMGIYSERRRFTTAGQEQTRRFGPRAGTQMVGGLDIRVAPRIKMFAQGRFEVRSFGDPGGGSVSQGFVGLSYVLR